MKTKSTTQKKEKAIKKANQQDELPLLSEEESESLRKYVAFDYKLFLRNKKGVTSWIFAITVLIIGVIWFCLVWFLPLKR